MFRRILTAAITVAFAALLLVLCWPQLLGLERAPVVAQVVSFRGVAFVVAIALIVLFTLVALISASLRRFVASLALLLLVFAAVTLGVLTMRGLGNPSMPTKAPDELTVLSWNTLGDAPGARAIADLVIEQDADVVVASRDEHRDRGGGGRSLLAAEGRADAAAGGRVRARSPRRRSTSLLISTSKLGEYAVDDSVGNTRTIPSVVAVPVDGSGPTIVAAHPVAPVPGKMGTWRDGLDWLAGAAPGVERHRRGRPQLDPRPLRRARHGRRRTRRLP